MRQLFSGLNKTLAMVGMFSAAIVMHAESDFERMCHEMTEHSLPLVNLTVATSRLSKYYYIKGHITIADPQQRTDGQTIFDADCNLRYRGGTSLSYAKKSFAIKLIDKDGNDLDAHVLGIREENSWILDAMAIDRARMRNRVLFDIWNEASVTPWGTKHNNRNGTQGFFVEVFLNGAYHGLYCMTDKIDRKLLGLKKPIVNDDKVTVRGLQYKCDNWTTAAVFGGYDATARVDTTYWNGFELKVPENYPSIDTWRPLMDIINITRKSYASLKNEYQNWFYKENLIDYMTFVLAFRITDNSIKNTYMSTVDITQDKRFIFTPWDLDATLGGSWDGKWENATSTWRLMGATVIYRKLYDGNVGGFADDLHRRWVELRSSIFSTRNLEKKMNFYATQLQRSGAWQRERSKWNGKPVPLDESPFYWTKEIPAWYERNITAVNTLLGTPTGDVDMNGVVNGSDITTFYNLLLTGDESDFLPACDVDMNGIVNGSDVTALYSLLINR